jgi:hypothetical protein
MFLDYHLLYRIAIPLLIAALVMQHGVKADSTQTPILMDGGKADMSIGRMDAKSGDNDGMGMDDEVGDDTTSCMTIFEGFDDKVLMHLEMKIWLIFRQSMLSLT